MKFFMENLLQLFTLVAELVEEIGRIGGTDCNAGRKRAKHQLRAQPLCEMCSRSSAGGVRPREPHGDDLPAPHPCPSRSVNKHHAGTRDG
jgi:hypothetical protein